MPTPFQTIADSSEPQGEEATPVHHEAVKSDIADIMRKHDEGLKPYMEREASSPGSLSPEEYHDYHSRLTDKARDLDWSNKILKEHNQRATVGKGLLDKHKDMNSREKVNKILGITEE